MDERLALVEVRRRAFAVRIIDLHHLDSRAEQVIGNELMPPVIATLDTGGENRVRFEQRVEGIREGIDIDRPLDVCGKADEIMCLGEHFLAVRQLSDDR
jgi:hypothetical protein